MGAFLEGSDDSRIGQRQRTRHLKHPLSHISARLETPPNLRAHAARGQYTGRRL